jgi:hypothetical protein
VATTWAGTVKPAPKRAGDQGNLVIVCGWRFSSYFLVQKSRLKTAWNGFEWRSVAGRIVFWPKGQKVLD